MGTIFNLDNPVWSFMGKVADLIILNIVALICCIPVVTIGASWTAMYFVAIRIVRKEEGYVIRDFFRSFKENFKQATIIWLLVILVAAVFAGDIFIYQMMPDQIPKVIMIAICALAYLVLGTVVYVFPILSRFQNTTKNTIKNAFILSIANLPSTLIFIVLIILPIVLIVFVVELAPILLLMGISLPAYLSSKLFVRIFRKVEPAPETEGEDAQEAIEA